MKVLMVHKFFYIEGGAERYVFNLSDLLRQKGHQVIPFAMKDSRNFSSEYEPFFADRFGPDQLFETTNPLRKLSIAGRVVFNRQAQQKLEALIEETRPDIAHVHSVYHHLSPSVLFALKKFKLPVVMTLHDYKLVCPNYIFLDGKRRVCESCRGKHFWHAFVKKCFRDSYAASLLVSIEAYVNAWMKSYRKNVDLFISPSEFLAGKIRQYGYADKPVYVLPYTLDLNAYRPCFEASDYFVFMGRLTHEKGLHFLLDAVKKIPHGHLLIIGTGPLQGELEERIRTEGITNVTLAGYKAGEELKDLVRRGQFTVVPSEWHDNSPLVIYESLALGKAVIGAQMGGIPELIEEGVDGYTFQRGDLLGLVDRINRLLGDPSRTAEMGKNGRRKAEQLFNAEHHYQTLMRFYEEAFSLSRRGK